MITQKARLLINLRDSISLIFSMIILAILTGLTRKIGEVDTAMKERTERINWLMKEL